MNWGTIIFVLVAVLQGYAKWRKKQADEAKRAATASKKRPSVRPNGVRSKQISLPPRSIQPTRHLRPVPRGCRATATPSVGGERLLAQARSNQTAAGLGTSEAVELPGEGVPGCLSAQSPATPPGNSMWISS